MRNLSNATFMLIFLRTYLVGAVYNMRGLQNVGFMYAIDPGLASIHTDPAQLRKARGRYVRHYNCHLFWTPLLAGIFLRTECDIANGRMTPQAFTAIKDTAANTLSALGDSVFGGTLLVTWGLVCSFLIIGNQVGAAIALSVFLFLGLQFFKICTFAAGLRYGFATLLWLKQCDFINWGDRFKIVNALVLLVTMALCMPARNLPGFWALAVVCSMFAAWLTARLHVPRTLQALIVTTVLLLLP